MNVCSYTIYMCMCNAIVGPLCCSQTSYYLTAWQQCSNALDYGFKTVSGCATCVSYQCIDWYTHTYIYTHCHTHTDTHTAKHAHSHTYIYTHTRTHTVTYIHTYTHTHTHTHTHSHTHSCIHIHAYTFMHTIIFF